MLIKLPLLKIKDGYEPNGYLIRGDFKAWDTKREMFTNFMIIDNMLKFMDKVTGVWFRDDEQKRFKLLQSGEKLSKNLHD